jgi:hypothetical protein
MLDPLIEIIFDGIRARKKEDAGQILYLRLDDTGVLEKTLKKKEQETSSKDKTK